MVSELSFLRPSSSGMATKTTYTSSLFSDLKKLLVECFGTPWWISDLSAMADEVRNRTIVVKIHSQIHPINDLVIAHVFSEIGIVEDVNYMPTESGFHSRVRFQHKRDVDWAWHHYNGRYLHKGCCKLEIRRSNDIITWHAQKIHDFKVAYGIDDAHVVKDNDSSLGKKLRKDDVIDQEELPRIQIKDELIVEKECSGLGARQVFVEMPDTQTCHEQQLSVEISKELGTIHHGELNLKVPAMMITMEQHNLKVDKFDAHIQDEYQDGLKALVVDELKDMVPCFDPGGKCNIALESNVAKEPLNVVVCQVLDEMLKPQQELKQVEMKTLEVLDELPAQEDYIRVLCIDPGGGSLLLVDNMFRLKVGEILVFPVGDSLEWKSALLEKNCNMWCTEDEIKKNLIEEGVLLGYLSTEIENYEAKNSSMTPLSALDEAGKINGESHSFDIIVNECVYWRHKLGYRGEFTFDPGGVKLACAHCVTRVLTEMRDSCCHFGALTDVGNYALVFMIIFVDKTDFCLVDSRDFSKNVATLAYELRINSHHSETDLLMTESLIVVNENGEIVIFDPGIEEFMLGDLNLSMEKLNLKAYMLTGISVASMEIWNFSCTRYYELHLVAIMFRLVTQYLRNLQQRILIYNEMRDINTGQTSKAMYDSLQTFDRGVANCELFRLLEEKRGLISRFLEEIISVLDQHAIKCASTFFSSKLVRKTALSHSRLRIEILNSLLHMDFDPGGAFIEIVDAFFKAYDHGGDTYSVETPLLRSGDSVKIFVVMIQLKLVVPPLETSCLLLYWLDETKKLTEAADSFVTFDPGGKAILCGDLLLYLSNENELCHSFLSRLKIISNYGNKAQIFDTMNVVGVVIVVTDMLTIKLSGHKLHFNCKENAAEMEFFKDCGTKHNLQSLGYLARDLDLGLLEELHSHFSAAEFAHFTTVSYALFVPKLERLHEDHEGYLSFSSARLYPLVLYIGNLINQGAPSNVILNQITDLVLIFDPGGECAKLTGQAQIARSLVIMSFMEFFLVLAMLLNQL